MIQYKKIKNIFGANKKAPSNDVKRYRFTFEEIELIKSISSKNSHTAIRFYTVNNGIDEVAVMIPIEKILVGINEISGCVIEAADPRKVLKPARIILEDGQFIGYTLK